MPSGSGQLGFTDLGNRAGQCFLYCHEKDHDPAVYPGTVSQPSSLQPSYVPRLYPKRK
jgi:hypothetical protein